MNHFGPGACHGAHPEHGASFFPIPALHEEQVCSICHATAFRSEAAWYGCRSAHCDFVLCHKCFEVEETLLPTTQVVMRNPDLPYTDAPRRPIAVHTRPKLNSFQLAPIYPGKLMEIVSRAISKEDGATYFRLQNGGWICSSNVVMLMPTDAVSNITRLAEVHMVGAEESAQRVMLGVEAAEFVAPARLREDHLVACLRESMQLIDENMPYGMVMSALALYPLLTAPVSADGADTVENEEDSNAGVPPQPTRGLRSALPPARGGRGGSRASSSSSAGACRSERVQTTLQFAHFVLHAALDDAARREELQEPLEQGTFLSLYGDVIGGCLLTLQRLSAVEGVVLPEAFVALVLRALGYYATVTSTLLRRLQPGEDEGFHAQRLSHHAVQRDNTDFAREQYRVYHVARAMTALCSELLQTALHRYPLWLRQLTPLRHQLIYIKDEALESRFCDLVAHSLTSLCTAPTSQRQFSQVDALEIAVRLLKKATLAVSQMSVLRMIRAGVHKDARNIAAVASVMLPSIMDTLVKPHSPSVVVAALDCLSELAFNDPRREAAVSFETPKRLMSRADEEDDRGSDMTSSGGHALCTCSQALHPGCAPFQTLHAYRLSGGIKVGLCAECASHHPPGNVEELSEPQFAHFQCQCPVCARRPAQRALPPPSVPATSSIKSIQNSELWAHVSQRVRADTDNAAILNSVGRLALRLAPPVSVVQSLAAALVHKSSLAPCAEAALAVAANRHMPPVHELLVKHPSSLLARYVSSPYAAVEVVSSYGSRAASLRKPFGGVDYVTPSQSHMKSELGLSPSPSIPGSTGISTSALTDRHGSSSVYLAHPSIDLFPTTSPAAFGASVQGQS